jgi:glycosyltransferase involved in cell wall biosynthesis
MRIGVISTTRTGSWGGSEELWADMAATALSQGHEAILSVYRWPSPPPRVRELQERGARVLERPLPEHRTLGQRMAARLMPPPSPWRALAALQPELVCISQGGAYDCALDADMMAFLYRTDTPYVIVSHSNMDAYIPEPVTRAAAAEAFERAHRAIFVSEGTIRTTERQLARPLPNAMVLRNPVNLSAVEALPWPTGETVRIAQVAALRAAWKAQDILFAALAGPGWQGRDWYLTLYGEGPDEAYLRDLAAHYGIDSRIHLAGHVADVRRIWAESHLLALPSRVESAPLALVEAMLCGRPAVVTDVGGMTEWVQEGETGYLAEAPTVAAVGAALERAWQDRVFWPALGRRAHAIALERYDPAPGGSLLRVMFEAVQPSTVAATGRLHREMPSSQGEG